VDAMKGSPLFAITQAAEKYYKNYVNIEPMPENVTKSLSEVFYAPISRQVGDAVIKAVTPLNSKLTLRPWDIREMPRGASSGTWIPKTSSYLDGKTFVYRVEVPGFKPSSYIKRGAEEPKTGSFIRINPVKDAPGSDSDNFRYYTVSGRREKEQYEANEDGSGTFSITFGQPMSHDALKATLEDGVFQVISKFRDIDDDNL
jgi:HSP20 family molecular chaperone IbpA